MSRIDRVKRKPRTVERKKQLSSQSVQERISILRDSFVSGLRNATATSRSLRDRSPRVRAAAIELIAQHRADEYLSSVHSMLSDPSELVRIEALEAVGLLEEASGEHHEGLVCRLRDTKALIRITAIESLVQLRDTSAMPQIAARLKDTDPLVRAYAAIALAELGSKTCVDLILDALSVETADAATAGFLVSLVMLGDDTKLVHLLALLLSEEYRVRCFVANSLIRLGLEGEHLQAARAGVQEALDHPLGHADESNMFEVLDQLSAGGRSDGN